MTALLVFKTVLVLLFGLILHLMVSALTVLKAVPRLIGFVINFYFNVCMENPVF